MTCRLLLLAVPVCAPLASPALALTITFSTVPGDTLTTSQAAAFNTAAGAWEAVLTDPVTVNAQVGFTSALPTGVLGSTSAALTLIGYDAFKAAYAADAKSAADTSALANLPFLVPGGAVVATTAEAKALGSPATTGVDGTIQFSASFPFADTRAALTGGTYDLIGIAEHEIGHLLGFTSQVDNFNTSYKSVLDLFRYGAPGSPSFLSGAPAYLSADGGATGLASFSTGINPSVGDGYQASHWKQGTYSNGQYALLNPTTGLGQQEDVTPLDALALDVLGYDLIGSNVAVPEPAAALLLAPALLGLMQLRRRAA